MADTEAIDPHFSMETTKHLETKTVDQLDLTHIYRVLRSTTAKYTSSSTQDEDVEKLEFPCTLGKKSDNMM